MLAKWFRMLIALTFVSFGLMADASSTAEDGQMDLSSESRPAPAWNPQNLTENRSRVRDFVEGLVDQDGPTEKHATVVPKDESSAK